MVNPTKTDTARGTSAGDIYRRHDPAGEQRKIIDPIVDRILSKVKGSTPLITDCQFLFKMNGDRYSLTCMEQNGIEIESERYLFQVSVSKAERKFTLRVKDRMKSHQVKFGGKESDEIVDGIAAIFSNDLIDNLTPQSEIDLKVWDGGFLRLFSDPWKKVPEFER